MIDKDNSLIVVSIFSGRKFPFRSKCLLIAEGRFDGELLTTDPVHHSEEVQFNQELAWTVDKKALHQHRLQRSSLRIQFFAVDHSKTQRELLGYIILDLRSASLKHPARWLQLLNSKYSSKPEVKVAIYIDKEKEETNFEEPKKEKSSITHTTKLKPVLNEEDGYFQIGETEQCADQFILSVTIAFATCLPNLLPSERISAADSGYYFYYSLMGSEITHEPFYDLLHPNFPSVRASVHIRSSLDILREFFKNQPGLEIHLCSGNQSLGRSLIRLDSLIKPTSTELFMQPLTLEGTFELEPPNCNKTYTVKINQDSKPRIGASVSLRQLQDVKIPREEQVINDDTKITFTDEKSNSKESKDMGLFRLNFEKYYYQCHTEDIRNFSEDEKKKGIITPSISGSGNTVKVNASETLAHHFSFSVRLNTLCEMDKSLERDLVIRYCYPFFGISEPISSPMIRKLNDETTVDIPKGYCAFDFAALRSQVFDAFQREPLKFQILVQHNNSLEVLADGQADLRKVLESPDILSTNVKGKQGSSKIWNGMLDLCLAKQINFQTIPFCKIDVQFCLEDWGVLNNQQSIKQEDNQKSVRSTEEYKVALELEIWKEKQTQKFQEQLREKERKRMEAITDEWKTREKERELLVKKKISEYGLLETQLRKTLLDIEKREKNLTEEEESFNKLKQNLQYEYERKMKDIKDGWQRMTEETEHKLSLEKSKANSLREEVNKIRSELKEAENKYHFLEREFRDYKEQLSSKPECRLQSEINMLHLEKSELEKKLLVTTNAKVHYKQQWAKAIHELARFRMKEQANAKHQLKKQHQELQQLKMRYLAAEENDISKNEKRQLEMIKEELNKLRVSRSPSISAPTSVEGDDEHLSRLIEERDTLLQTGTYNSEDRIIIELEKQIRECISKHNR